jgi:hypothetical protein
MASDIDVLPSIRTNALTEQRSRPLPDRRAGRSHPSSFMLPTSSTLKQRMPFVVELPRGGCMPNAAWSALDAWRRLGMTRYPAHSLIDRIWELRENLSGHDATHVALAELLDCSLLTADSRLARSPGTGGPITVVPR